MPWERPDSGFTAAFEALAPALCRELPVRQAAALLRCQDEQSWRRIEFYVDQARALESLKSARAWRLRMALREVYARSRQHNSTEQADGDVAAWSSWARSCRLEPFKKLAATIKERIDAVVRGMLEQRSNAFVESMNGHLQQAKRAARGYRTAKSFTAIAYPWLSRLKNLPAHPFSAAAPAW